MMIPDDGEAQAGGAKNGGKDSDDKGATEGNIGLRPPPNDPLLARRPVPAARKVPKVKKKSKKRSKKTAKKAVKKRAKKSAKAAGKK